MIQGSKVSAFFGYTALTLRFFVWIISNFIQKDLNSYS